jgi:6-pyruvoyltetrahydropterin/6-carboxytetrahydropterin synthase
MITLERRFRFSASHRYWRPDWTEARNREVFGRCANAPGHGHNYRLYVTVSGPIEPETGFLVDLGRFDELVRARVLDVVDHQHLNLVLPELGGAPPTTENVVAAIHARLSNALPKALRLIKLRLEEDEDLAAEWTLALF